MILVISASLHPESRSRILANTAKSKLNKKNVTVEVFDLSEKPLPLCDGLTAYGDSNVQELSRLVQEADAILLASPVYNYDVNAAAKNAIELTGKAWTNKLVGILLAAGGPGSYMSAMGVANSLMLDFRCLVLPRFIYALGDAFQGDELSDQQIDQRITELTDELLRLSTAIKT
ncbi:MAG: NAD(P)H-dependent oxidoreductase [Planctomycetota bacterium]|nr:NAD(P)H-dependent oxidoreductase [Planctomycetota bacterium]